MLWTERYKKNINSSVEVLKRSQITRSELSVSLREKGCDDTIRLSSKLWWFMNKIELNCAEIPNEPSKCIFQALYMYLFVIMVVERILTKAMHKFHVHFYLGNDKFWDYNCDVKKSTVGKKLLMVRWYMEMCGKIMRARPCLMDCNEGVNSFMYLNPWPNI